MAVPKQLTAKHVGHGSNKNQESWVMFALEGVDIRLDLLPHIKISSTCVSTGTEGLNDIIVFESIKLAQKINCFGLRKNYLYKS